MRVETLAGSNGTGSPRRSPTSEEGSTPGHHLHAISQSRRVGSGAVPGHQGAGGPTPWPHPERGALQGGPGGRPCPISDPVTRRATPTNPQRIPKVTPDPGGSTPARGPVLKDDPERHRSHQEGNQAGGDELLRPDHRAVSPQEHENAGDGSWSSRDGPWATAAPLARAQSRRAPPATRNRTPAMRKGGRVSMAIRMPR